jgi:catechol 2,3-dioxygenase-like lactoylglutathione lyase family enzyme
VSERGPDPTQWNFANPILQVSDLPRSIAYYREVFGLVPIWMWEDRIAGVSTESAPIELYLSRADEPTSSSLAVFVNDADAAYEKCRAAGANIIDQIETKAWGLRGFSVRDPDGNLIGISHEAHSPEGRPEYRDALASRLPLRDVRSCAASKIRTCRRRCHGVGMRMRRFAGEGFGREEGRAAREWPSARTRGHGRSSGRNRAQDQGRRPHVADYDAPAKADRRAPSRTRRRSRCIRLRRVERQAVRSYERHAQST